MPGGKSVGAPLVGTLVGKELEQGTHKGCPYECVYTCTLASGLGFDGEGGEGISIAPGHPAGNQRAALAMLLTLDNALLVED